MTWRLLPAIWESDLSPLDKLVLLCLSKYSDSNGRNAKPAQATISRLTGIGPRRVRTALATLKKRGLIVAEGKGRKGTIAYRINLPLANKDDSSRAADVGTTTSSGRHRDSGNPIDSIQLKNPSNLKDSKRDSYFDSDSDYEGPKRDQYGRNTETISEQAMRLHRARRQQT
jgi:DNA-binding transcriptional ArsR family regulator